MKDSQSHGSDFSLECPLCRAPLKPDNQFCAVCGARLNEDLKGEELRGVLYLLSELARWEAGGQIESEQATRLRERYEARREELREQLETNGDRAKTAQQRPPVPPSSAEHRAPSTQYQPARPPTEQRASTPLTAAQGQTDQGLGLPQSQTRHAAFNSVQPASTSQQIPRRTFIEGATDPRNLRLLLYTGAAMFVVGIVIWLRDVLYLKLQEPVVQASLLAIGTILVTSAGWYTILRTRQKLTGRALTLTGSLLVPINFWFLVRSGLISNNGRAWVVCALCTLLYAHTALFLRERLYVYLSAAASVATLWALIFRAESEAFGLYALAMMAASLVFLHLSRLFPLTVNGVEDGTTSDKGGPAGVEIRARATRWSYELWGAPLVHAALLGATLCALAYMPLRLWPSPTLHDGIFRLRANTYDSSIAMLLFAAGAYVLWFAGRYIYAARARFLYTLGALSLFWTEFLALDGLRLPSRTQVLIVAATTLVVALAARRTQADALSKALHRASLLVAATALAPAAIASLQTEPELSFLQSVALACIAATFAISSTPRFCDRLVQIVLAHAAALFASIAFLVALLSAHLRSETLFVIACALWPFALYLIAQVARAWRETQLAAPFVRTADGSFVLLLLWASSVALLLHSTTSDQQLIAWRPSMFSVLVAAIIYGALRAARERSNFAVALGSLAAIVLVASSLDALRVFGLWPETWPTSAVVICAAFLMAGISRRLLTTKTAEGQRTNGESVEPAAIDTRSLAATVQVVMDCVAVVCALAWFAITLFYIRDGGFRGAIVLLLALLYWMERARSRRVEWTVAFATTHAGAFLIALFIALRVDPQWFAFLSALTLFPLLLAISCYARTREALWLSRPTALPAVATLMLASFATILQAWPNLQVGNRALLAQSVTAGAVALASFSASLFAGGQARVNYFRAGLSAAVVSFALFCLRAGYEPTTDVEIYTSPVAVMLLVIAYLSLRREWDEYETDISLLLWMGSLLLCAPLLLHALEFRLILDTPALGRDLGTLCASLALVLFGIVGRLRAPVLIGGVTLAAELAVLAVTSVDWTQVPLKIYLVTVGALIVLICWMLEFRREQLLVMRKRLHVRREYARERFGEWR